jgi:hypothetical protein
VTSGVVQDIEQSLAVDGGVFPPAELEDYV